LTENFEGTHLNDEASGKEYYQKQNVTKFYSTFSILSHRESLLKSLTKNENDTQNYLGDNDYLNKNHLKCD